MSTLYDVRPSSRSSLAPSSFKHGPFYSSTPLSFSPPTFPPPTTSLSLSLPSSTSTSSRTSPASDISGRDSPFYPRGRRGSSPQGRYLSIPQIPRHVSGGSRLSPGRKRSARAHSREELEFSEDDAGNGLLAAGAGGIEATGRWSSRTASGNCSSLSYDAHVGTVRRSQEGAVAGLEMHSVEGAEIQLRSGDVPATRLRPVAAEAKTRAGEVRRDYADVKPTFLPRHPYMATAALTSSSAIMPAHSHAHHQPSMMHSGSLSMSSPSSDSVTALAMPAHRPPSSSSARPPSAVPSNLAQAAASPLIGSMASRSTPRSSPSDVRQRPGPPNLPPASSSPKFTTRSITSAHSVESRTRSNTHSRRTSTSPPNAVHLPPLASQRPHSHSVSLPRIAGLLHRRTASRDGDLLPPLGDLPLRPGAHAPMDVDSSTATHSVAGSSTQTHTPTTGSSAGAPLSARSAGMGYATRGQAYSSLRSTGDAMDEEHQTDDEAAASGRVTGSGGRKRRRGEGEEEEDSVADIKTEPVEGNPLSGPNVPLTPHTSSMTSPNRRGPYDQHSRRGTQTPAIIPPPGSSVNPVSSPSRRTGAPSSNVASTSNRTEDGRPELKKRRRVTISDAVPMRHPHPTSMRHAVLDPPGASSAGSTDSSRSTSVAVGLPTPQSAAPGHSTFGGQQPPVSPIVLGFSASNSMEQQQLSKTLSLKRQQQALIEQRQRASTNAAIIGRSPPRDLSLQAEASKATPDRTTAEASERRSSFVAQPQPGSSILARRPGAHKNKTLTVMTPATSTAAAAATAVPTLPVVTNIEAMGSIRSAPLRPAEGPWTSAPSVQSGAVDVGGVSIARSGQGIGKAATPRAANFPATAVPPQNRTVALPQPPATAHYRGPRPQFPSPPHAIPPYHGSARLPQTGFPTVLPPSKASFLSAFETVYDSMSESRALQTTLEEQIRRSATLITTLQASEAVLEGLVDKRLAVLQTSHAKDLQMLEKRLEALENRLPPSQASSSTTSSNISVSMAELLARLDKLERAAQDSSTS